MAIDLSYFENISGGDKAFVKQMLEMFKDSTLTEVEKIEELLTKKDWTMIGLIAHKIKAPIQMIGREDIVEDVLKLEKSAKSQMNLDEIGSMIKIVKDHVIRVNDEIDILVKSM